MTAQTRPLRVTLDSSALKWWSNTILPALTPYEYEVGVTSVTIRESRRQVELSLGPRLWKELTETAVWNESSWGGSLWGGSAAFVLLETGVLDETPVMVLGTEEDADLHDAILRIIDSQLPKALANDGQAWSAGHHNHLRDGMILATHAHYNHDLFISNDRVAHLQHRAALERLCRTRIANPEEPGEVARVAAEIVGSWGS